MTLRIIEFYVLMLHQILLHCWLVHADMLTFYMTITHSMTNSSTWGCLLLKYESATENDQDGCFAQKNSKYVNVFICFFMNVSCLKRYIVVPYQHVIICIQYFYVSTIGKRLYVYFPRHVQQKHP